MKRLLILLALLAGACGPIPAPEPPGTYRVGLTTSPCDAAATFTLDSGESYLAQPDAPGSCHKIFKFQPPAGPGYGSWLTVTAEGYIQYESGRIPLPGPGEMEAINLQPVPPPVTELPGIVIRGEFFGLAGGAYWTAIQASDFNLLGRFVNGEDIEPVLAQRAAAGYNLLRVWTAFDIGGIGRLIPVEHPDFYSYIPRFLDAAAKHGLYVEFTGYTGINDPDHWTQLVSASRGKTNVILELVNELDQNTNEPDYLGRIFNIDQYTKPVGIISSHGSNGSQHLAVRPWWDYEEYHSNDAPEWWRKVGHNAMEFTEGAPAWEGSHVPTLANENTRYPDKPTTTLERAYDAAAGGALLAAGSCFHSVHGKTSELWSGVELEAAVAWAQGAKSVPLSCQDGPYRHDQVHVEMENWPGTPWYKPGEPTYNRVYQRGYDPACIVRIR